MYESHQSTNLTELLGRINEAKKTIVTLTAVPWRNDGMDGILYIVITKKEKTA